MDAPADVKSALAAICDEHLYALRHAIDTAPNSVPGLLAWLEAAVYWEINRRAGMHYPLLGPIAAIDDTETASSLATLAILAASFRRKGQGQSEPIAEFLEQTAATLSAELQRPDT